MNFPFRAMIGAAMVVAQMALADDVPWQWDTSLHPAEDSFERTVVFEDALDVSPLWTMVASSAAQIDAGAYCVRVTPGTDLNSRPLGTLLTFR
ncbi:MAG: hypothetical protein IKO72_08800 [Kiritimatiellae bacterium]|nr:hypothetical protein [Kiritimatiellia bacterium]